MAAGNIRAPSKALCLEWVRECWEALSTKLIMKSFRTCGISVNIDGTDDREIHCRKEGGMAAGARATITAETARLLFGNCSEDLFTDPEDEDELEENEAVLHDC